mmetsp:Transcript_17155/g.38632  ORF Transcript_17155/g.38632 Transcript_17155/m.38632 type:complete len:106 (+) Transcript_17155:220-537(+)
MGSRTVCPTKTIHPNVPFLISLAYAHLTVESLNHAACSRRILLGTPSHLSRETSKVPAAVLLTMVGILVAADERVSTSKPPAGGRDCSECNGFLHSAERNVQSST